MLVRPLGLIFLIPCRHSEWSLYNGVLLRKVGGSTWFFRNLRGRTMAYFPTSFHCQIQILDNIAVTVIAEGQLIYW